MTCLLTDEESLLCSGECVLKFYVKSTPLEEYRFVRKAYEGLF